MCSCLALTTPNYLCGGDEWESLHVLPEPRPTTSTGRSLTDIPTPVGPIAVSTVGRDVVVLTPPLESVRCPLKTQAARQKKNVQKQKYEYKAIRQKTNKNHWVLTRGRTTSVAGLV